MAKYTDPNTGVKYSTHTGLKVFTVIVVILLIVSIVLNVVLYMQNSDDSELDAESGELYDDSEGSGDGDDGDGENPDGILPDDGDGEEGEGDTDSSDGESFAPPLNPEDYEDYIDTDTVVENDNAVLEDGEEFDENGVAKCTYYYDDCEFVGCEDGCVGHEYYLTTGGGVYADYPVLKTQVLVGEDGSMDINSEIRVSFVFYKEAQFVYDEDNELSYTDSYYLGQLDYIEIASLTGKPLEIESVELRQHVYYDSDDSSFISKPLECHSKEGLEVELRTDSWCVNTDYTRTYYYLGTDGYYTFSIKTTDGKNYYFNYCTMLVGTGVHSRAEIRYVD